MKIITSLIIGLMLIVSALAYTTTQITAPTADFETQESQSVNVSGMVNASAFPDIRELNSSLINITIMNKSCQSCGYDAHSSYIINVSNQNGSLDVFWNQTITLQPGYNWIFLNFTNVSVAVLPAHTVTEARIINIDPERFILDIGDLGLKMGDANEVACSATTRGLIKYNASDGFMGCTANGYKSLNSS